MDRFGKFPVAIILVALAAITASLFGALHNQLSYSVGPDYFHGLKFPQFDIPPDMAPRLGAALVGVQASWWAGAVVGLPAFAFGLLTVPRASSYLAAGIGAIGLVVLLAAFASLNGLVAGLTLPGTGLLDGFATPEGVDRGDFLRAGLMHDGSYLGAALGGLVAFWPMIVARRRDRAQLEGAA